MFVCAFSRASLLWQRMTRLVQPACVAHPRQVTKEDKKGDECLEAIKTLGRIVGQDEQNHSQVPTECLSQT